MRGWNPTFYTSYLSNLIKEGKKLCKAIYNLLRPNSTKNWDFSTLEMIYSTINSEFIEPAAKLVTKHLYKKYENTVFLNKRLIFVGHSHGSLVMDELEKRISKIRVDIFQFGTPWVHKNGTKRDSSESLGERMQC